MISAKPALTTSDLSVESRIAKTSFRIHGTVVSSWMPPESVIIVSHFSSKLRSLGSQAAAELVCSPFSILP